ncbi:MAG: gamma-glutamyltransferase family protein [Candidatus Izemoplasmataceae bacterium]
MFDLHHNPYLTKQNIQVSKRGMIASSSPLAAQAGLEILKMGGNAVDAAIATSAMITVTEPTSNGIGGDAFCIVWIKDKMYGLNASGKSPDSLTIDKVKALGFDTLPKYGLIPVTVPGLPSAWKALSDRFGKLPFEVLFEPAIKVAREGYAVSVSLAEGWKNAFNVYEKAFKDDTVFDGWFDTFTINNNPPKAGELFIAKDHAKTLSLIAKTKTEAFYTGEIADQIHAFSKAHNGFITKKDLENHTCIWVEPISVNYKGFDIWELPPNGQGIVTLQALNILKECQLSSKLDISTLHHQIEATKLAFSDAFEYVTDHAFMNIDFKVLLSKSYAMKRAKEIKETAIIPKPLTFNSAGTVYFATADQEGNMVSFIQSNYYGFGSGVVVPNTGIALQNRGFAFTLDKYHPNKLEPNKRPFHTIIPGFITKDTKAIGPFGIMGGFMQPQAHLQVLTHIIDFNFNPQAALDAPRWQWIKENEIHVEPNFDQSFIDALIKKGHNVIVSDKIPLFGRGQVIWRDPISKIYYGATEKRTDGTIALW